MIKVERVGVMNMENAIRGARNPLNSWARMDSYYDEKGDFVLGENDLSLAVRLARAGSDHRKYLRQIFVIVAVHSCPAVKRVSCTSYCIFKIHYADSFNLYHKKVTSCNIFNLIF